MNKRTNRFTAVFSFLRNNPKSFPSLIASLFLLMACEEQKEDPLRVRIEHADEHSVQLHWLPLETNIGATRGYKVWRIDNEIGSASLEQIALVKENWLYSDIQLPISNSLSYYVTTNIDGKEYKSNTVECGGGTAVYALPSQMEMIPDTDIAILREAGTLILLDYGKKNITKRVEFNNAIGQFAIAEYNGTFEVIVPCRDNNIYILSADGLVPFDTIETPSPAFAIAQNSNGKIFCSTESGSDGLLVYDRKTKTQIEFAAAEPACHLFLTNDNHVVAVSSRWNRSNIAYYTFDDDGRYVSSKFHFPDSENVKNGYLMKVSDKYIVTAKEGFLFTADENMTFITKLSDDGEYSDFEFGADGATIYSAIIGQKGVFKSMIVGDDVGTSTIATEGYPLMMSRSANVMYILSSPNMTRADGRDSQMNLEKIMLN